MCPPVDVCMRYYPEPPVIKPLPNDSCTVLPPVPILLLSKVASRPLQNGPRSPLICERVRTVDCSFAPKGAGGCEWYESLRFLGTICIPVVQIVQDLRSKIANNRLYLNEDAITRFHLVRKVVLEKQVVRVRGSVERVCLNVVRRVHAHTREYMHTQIRGYTHKATFICLPIIPIISI